MWLGDFSITNGFVNVSIQTCLSKSSEIPADVGTSAVYLIISVVFCLFVFFFL